jgi:NADH:ubiquinone oxidoreductase subunit E
MARVGVFVCWCGANIAEMVDAEAVAEYAGTIPGVVVSKSYRYMCSDPGQRIVTDAIVEHKLTGVVVASCSPRMHEPTFRKTAATVGLNPYMLEMANIREHCSWAHTDRAEATEKAKDLVRLMVEKVKRNHPLEEIKVPMTRRVLVIGAGIAGIQAALDVAAAGHEVVLVERKPSIGGHMSMLDETFPTLDCSQCILTPRMVEVMQSEKIKLYSFSEIEDVSGYIGNFEVKIRQKARSVDLTKCTGCGDCWNNCMARNRVVIPEPTSVQDRLDAEMLATIGTFLDPGNGHPVTLIGVLQQIQKTYNYLPEEALRYVSERMDVRLSQIYAVATFYKAFSLEPKGRNIIRVCTGTACHLKGSIEILRELEKKLDVERGGTTRDMMFTLETVNCLGCCALSPVMTIGEEYYGNLDITQLDKIIESCYETCNA